MDEPGAHSFEPPIKPKPLDSKIAHLRNQYEQEGWPPLDAKLQPRIDAHIYACQLALNGLAELHQRLADETDIDLTAETRWAALWEAIGRAIATGNAFLDQLRLGHTIQVVSTARVLYESLDLVIAASSADEEAIRLWLRGKKIPIRTLAEARRAFYDKLSEELAAEDRAIEDHAVYRAQLEGLAGEGIDTTGGAAAILRQIAGRVYGDLSEIAHGRRKGIADAIVQPLRQFSYRRHPDARIRAHYAKMAEVLIEQMLYDIGFALEILLGMDQVRALLLPYLAGIETARQTQPLEL